MLIYVIPLVIVVIALVFFKKRQSAQESDKANAQKAKAKKANSSAKIAPNRTQAVEPVAKPVTTALNDDTRKKIQSLIDERNFFSAEAQINQALKKDNTQHELYLYLLDIHILQKDEFAISQLISHVRSLELEDIIAQAEAKQANFDKAQNKTLDTIAFTSPTEQPASVAKPQAQNNADFDALMGSPATTPEPKKEAPPAPVAAAPAVEEIKPLDFNLSFDSAADKPAEVVTAKVAEETQPLDFAAPEVAPVEKVAEAAPTAEIKPLDFSLDFAPQTSPEVAQPQPTAEPAPLDFSFTTEEPATEAPKAEPLSFDLSSIGAQPEAEPTAPASTGVSFDISQVSTPASSTDQSDPLVQSFPELLNSNEITLNLELAAQYIQLGAFDAAREILEEKESEYSAEQIEQVKVLRNQIAS
jgi:hypothetical protein